MENRVLQVADFSYKYRGAPTPAVCNVSLTVGAGECLCLTGPSGCGKTTLLLAIQGLLRDGLSSGAVRVSKNGSGFDVGMVFQNADSQILCSTVEEEVAFGPDNMGLSSDEIEKRVHKALEAVEMEDFERRNVETLSAGEKQRLAIASVLSLNPHLLLLDEPTSQLDAPGKEQLLTALKKLKEQGRALLIVDHDLTMFSDIADRSIFMESGRLCDSTMNCAPAPNSVMPPSSNTPFVTSSHTVSPTPAIPPFAKGGRGDLACPLAIDIDGLCLSGHSGHPVFKNTRLKIRRGELVHLFGYNGAGKSTLLRLMVGLDSPEEGRIRIAGVESPRPQQLPGKVSLLFQNPQRHFFEDTVGAEAGFALARMGLPPEERRLRVEQALAFCEVSDFAERSPLTLSFGEQHRVALASVIAPQPEILLLDEPFSGLDFARRRRVLSFLSEVRRRFGTTVVIASHDPLFDPQWADRRLLLRNGKIEDV
ncbi:ATP-binding cassette domain-containing protein [Candidatus Poribacteria bacterium]|nr:ATP-binding cassette domain-containing protein [Candidatus Poribacteria bacterium]